MSVTIKELTDVVAASAGITKVAADKVVTDLFAAISAGVKGNQDVVIRNFGRFYTHERAARKGRNPRTGEAIDIASKTVIKFTPRGDLK
jgi:DNA-binding protein HU-beta